MPPYWINMGAVAISTLAGALLAACRKTRRCSRRMRPFVLGLTVMFWATATWWIPMLLVLGVWRHRVRGGAGSRTIRSIGASCSRWDVCHRAPSGSPTCWTHPFLLWIARGFVIAATAVWLLTFLGLARHGVYAVLLWVRPASRAPRETRDGRAAVEAWTTGGIAS